MNIRKRFLDIKRQFFPRWDRGDYWRITTKSSRRVHGRCDEKRRVIEIVKQTPDADDRDCLLIHEICHAVADRGHGKVWQRRVEKAAIRADGLGRDVLAKKLRQEIVDYQNAPKLHDHVYQTVQDWLTENPNLTLRQVKLALADEFGLLVREVDAIFKRIESVFQEAKRDGLDARALTEEHRS
jgi:hypothetical protein